MKVLLVQDIDNLGLAGEIKEVADGYARNYLIPGNLAVLATPGALKQADLHRRRAAERRDRLAAEMAALVKAISKTSLTFQAKAGEKGRLYGSVTTADIADKLAETLEQEVDRRKIVLDAAIKQLGTHTVTVRLSADYTADFEVIVEALETAEAAEAAAEEEPGAEEETVAEEEPVAEVEPAVEE
jgi:large subunit ribosomal protein L9